MAEGLPKGLVASNTDVVSEGIERYDRVNQDDLARLWRVYSTNRTLLVNDIGRRLENFFWRIWGSRRCLERLRGSQVAFMFSLISEGEIIRTTPIPSPRTSRLVTRTTTEQPLQSSSSSDLDPDPDQDSEVSPTTTTELDNRLSRQQPPESPSIPPTVEEEKGRRRSSSRPPPILKKRGLESGSKKTATILTPTWKTGATDPDHDDPEDVPRKQVGKSSSSLSKSETLESPAQTEDVLSPTSLQGARAGNMKSKKKPSFVVGASSSKRRPAMARRKSSQSSSGGNSKADSPKQTAVFSPPTTSRRAGAASLSGEGTAVPGQAERPTSRSISPVSSSPFKRPPRDHLPLGADPPPEPSASSQDWLVSRNFRSSFADRIRGSVPSGNKSPAATGLSTSFQARGSSFGSVEGKGKGKAVEDEDLEDLRLERLPSQVLTEEEEPPEAGVLPRVRSQLTMMLQDTKQKDDRRPRKEEKKAESSSKGKSKKGKR